MANIRVPLQRGSPIAVALNYMSRLFAHGREMQATGGKKVYNTKIKDGVGRVPD